ncbi:MAG: regulatory protein [Candidatus Azotimanducaceae bacterium]|jgi:regulatory protein
MDLLARREHSVKELWEKLDLRFQKLIQKRSRKRSQELALEEAKRSDDSHYSEGASSQAEISSSDLKDLIYSEVSRLTAEGLQSDARLAEAYIRYRSNRGHGPLKISAELRNKGVLVSLIGEALNESGIDWGINVREVTIKKYGEGALVEPLDRQFRAKRNRFLIQRGFSYEHIAILE